jgi:hypothetical protein
MTTFLPHIEPLMFANDQLPSEDVESAHSVLVHNISTLETILNDANDGLSLLNFLRKELDAQKDHSTTGNGAQGRLGLLDFVDDYLPKVIQAAEASPITRIVANEETHLSRNIFTIFWFLSQLDDDKAWNDFLKQHSVLPLPRILDFCRCFAMANGPMTRSIMQRLISHNPITRNRFQEELKSLMQIIQPRLNRLCKKFGKTRATLANSSEALAFIRDLCCSLLPLVDCLGSLASDVLVEMHPHPGFLEALVEAYDVILTPIALKLIDREDEEFVGRIHQTKAMALGLVRASLQHSTLDKLPHGLESLISFYMDTLIPRMDSKEPPSPLPEVHRVFLTCAPFALDFECAQSFSKAIQKAWPKDDDSRLSFIFDTMSSNVQAWGLSGIQRDIASQSSVELQLAKPSQVGESAQMHPEHVEALSSLMDLFPETNVDRLVLLLQQEDGDVERATMRVLDGDLPSDLEVEKAKKPSPAFPLLSQRQSAFEMDSFDLQRAAQQGDGVTMIQGKKRHDDILQDKAWMHDMKASIIAAAEAPSDDELHFDEYDDEYDDAYGEDGDEVVNKRGARIALHVTDSEDDDPMAKHMTLLLKHFSINQSLFEPTSRKSKDRIALKQQTGLADEQLEGWAKMLLRNPSRMTKLMSMYEDAERRKSNRLHESSEEETQPATARPPATSRPVAPTQIDRARKDQRGNQARRRGHDKKMRGVLP